MHPLFSSHQPYFTPNQVNFPRTPVSQFVSLAKKRSRVILSILRLEMPCFCKYYRLPLRLSPFRPLFHRPNTQAAAPRLEKQNRFSIPPTPSWEFIDFLLFFLLLRIRQFQNSREMLWSETFGYLFDQPVFPRKANRNSLFVSSVARHTALNPDIVVGSSHHLPIIDFFSHFSSKAPFRVIFNFKTNSERFWSIFW